MHLEHENDVLKLKNESVYLSNNNVFFPELVWELVLSKIKNTVDIESCSNASPYFWKFLEFKRQSKVVFSRVLQQLSCFFHENNIVTNDDDSNNKSGTFSMGNFWKLREICKSWNITIEHLHHSSEAGQLRLRADMEHFENEHLSVWANDIFDPEMLPQRFLYHFDATHYDSIHQHIKKNPFLGRSVQLKEIVVGNYAEDEDLMYTNGILETLTKYGAEIWYSFLDFEDIAGTNLVEIYLSFVEFIKLMPNLKVLRVACKREYFDGNESWGVAFLRRMNQDALNRHIAESPIPTLSHLEYLSTTDLPTPMFNELLEKNTHISRLQVDRKVRHCDYSIFHLRLPNLTALGVMFCSFEDFYKFDRCELCLKLRKFYFWYNGSSGILRWSRLFQALQRQLGENCTELLIQMPLHKTEYQSIQTFNDTHFGRLNLLNLRQIAIMCDCAISLDFLLAVKHSLRAMFLRYFNGDEDVFLLKGFSDYENKQLVKFIGYEERMEISNIWKEFPVLIDLTLFRKKDMGGSVSYIRGRSIEGDIILEKDRWYRESV